MTGAKSTIISLIIIYSAQIFPGNIPSNKFLNCNFLKNKISNSKNLSLFLEILPREILDSTNCEKIQHYIENKIELDLEGRKIKNMEVVFLFKKVKYLNLKNNLIWDIWGIEKLTSLKKINLSKNPILDPSPLAALPNLEILDISHTKITDLSSLKKSQSLLNIIAINTDLGNFVGKRDDNCPPDSKSQGLRKFCNIK